MAVFSHLVHATSCFCSDMILQTGSNVKSRPWCSGCNVVLRTEAGISDVKRNAAVDCQ
jgi:hypothetical protein